MSASTAVLAFFAFGCSNTSYLSRDEKLYTGAEVKVEEKSDIPDKGDLEDQLDLLIKPEPNGKFLGLFRLKLWLYNKGLFKESMGEPPVLLESVAPDRVAAKMRILLENKGYFLPDVRYTINSEEHTANIQYFAAVQTPYRIKSIIIKGINSAVLDSIRSTMDESILAPGDQYDLDKLKQERERIDASLKEKGFFYFSPDFVLFQADSTAGERMIDLILQIKKEIPLRSTQVYTIGNVVIYSGYSLDRDSSVVTSRDSVLAGGVTYIDLDRKFQPDVIVRSLFLKKGEVYSRSNYERSLNRLMNLGVFKFVNIRLNENGSNDDQSLETSVYLTPLMEKTIRFELQGVSKSNNLVGPVFESSYRNRNLFGGAELLTLSVDLGFETQFGGGQSVGNSYEIGTRGELELPKFVTPFTLNTISSLFVPKTHIALGVRLQHRLQYYQLYSVETSFGYHWNESIKTEHIFNPLSITFAQLRRTTPQFDAMLNSNPLLRKSFEEQFIIGQNYSFVYNNQFDKDQKNHLYFKGNVDLSGNLLNLGQSLFISHSATPEKPYRIFGMIYSQFYKFDVDLRYYINRVDQTSSLVGRMIAGIGIPYGNSAALPYVKQFFIGGANSVRAFVTHGLGPGSYKIPDTVAQSFIDQAGDIKLESNIEYRFPIVSILKGAVFIDAGNIWILKDDPSRPGGTFSGKTFLDQIALGTGLGVRLDLSFFILRLDLAFPLRIPSMPEADHWVIRKIDFGDPAWRSSNLMLNLAIGYPF